MVVSASKQRADDFSTFVMKLIKEMPLLQHLKPKRGQRDSKIAFDVGPANTAHAPSVTSRGISGQLAGSRATRIVADDCEIPNNSATEDMRDKLMKAVSEFEAILVPEGDTQIVFLGTPQTEESIYRKLYRDRGYPCRIWPARIPMKDKVDDYEELLSPMIVGNEWEPTDPRRFTEQDLNERQAAYGKSGFMLQFMLDTTMSDAEKYPLKTGDLIVTEVDMDMAPERIMYGSGPEQQLQLPCVGLSGDRWYRPKLESFGKVPGGWSGCAMAIDASGKGLDETGYAIVKAHHGKLYLVDSGGYMGGYDEHKVLRPLLEKARHHGVNMIILEDNFGQGMLEQLLRPLMAKIHTCKIESVRHNTMKESRIISTLEPVMNSHRLVVDNRVVNKDMEQVREDLRYSLFHQMTRLTNERGALKHDDRLDALAMVVAYWTKVLGQDEDEMIQERNMELLETELEIHMEHLLGGSRADHRGTSFLLKPEKHY
jgi:hypothetical protein